MKKLFLNLFVLTGFLILASCSGDDDGGGNNGGETATITIDGEAKTFNTVVEQEANNVRTISFSDSSDPTTVLTFVLAADVTGTSAIDQLAYFANNNTFTYDGTIAVSEGGNQNPQELSASVQVNTESSFKAVVSGVLSRANNGNFETVTITNGNFDVTY